MQPINLLVFAFRLFLAIGLVAGYSEVVMKMARAAVHAQTRESLSAARFNKTLWSKPSSESKKSGENRGRQ